MAVIVARTVRSKLYVVITIVLPWCLLTISRVVILCLGWVESTWGRSVTVIVRHWQDMLAVSLANISVWYINQTGLQHCIVNASASAMWECQVLELLAKLKLWLLSGIDEVVSFCLSVSQVLSDGTVHLPGRCSQQVLPRCCLLHV